MPRQVFTAGEILTAASMNDLSDATVMVFDDSAARGSAIPSPSEGMVTYLKDTDSLDKYTTDWEPVDTGGLIETKTAIITDAKSFGSVASGTNVAVTGLSITHEVADPSNKLIISAFFGAAANSANFGNIGLALHDGSSLIAVGDTASGRSSVTAGGIVTATDANFVVSMPSVQIVHTPGAGSKTYTVRAVNMHGSSATLYVNRSPSDSGVNNPRAVSALTIMEVAV